MQKSDFQGSEKKRTFPKLRGTWYDNNEQTKAKGMTLNTYKGEPIRMNKARTCFASFVVDRRRAIFAVMVIAAAVCLYLMTLVETNTDMTRYLPEKSAMKQGIDIMAEEFPPMQTSQTIRVMAEGLKPEEEEGLRDRLKSIPNVTAVAWEAESAEYHQDGRTLYVISTDAEYKSPEIKAIGKVLDRDFPEYALQWHDDDVGIPEVPIWILLCGVGAILLILLLMCGSWIEPVLFLMGIGIAVAINQGTNLIQGSVSTVTSSMASILQLVLSMDYSIILSNRFKQERTKNEDIAGAMKAAVANAFPSIVSSGMTTVAGLLMMVFMSFRIGMDLGVVLAKGVFLSMFCVLAVMPGVLIACDGLIRKTAKKSPRIPMRGLARFSDKMHTGVTVAFAVLMVAAFILQQQTGIVYTLQREDPVAETFPADNTLVLVYENRDEPAIPEICALLEKDEKVRSVTSWYTMLGTPFTAEEMAAHIPAMEGGMKLDRDLLSMIYYLRFGGSETLEMTPAEFLAFLSEHVAGNEMFAEYMTEEQRGMVRQAGSFAGLVSMLGPMTPQQMADLFSALAPGMDENALELLFLYRAGMENSDPAWKMTLEELFGFLYDTVQHDPRFAPMMGEEAKTMLAEARETLEDGKRQLAGPEHSRMVITTKYPDESPETFRFLEELSGACEEKFAGKISLIGNSAMNLEMSRSFGKEYLFITILTAAVIYLIVLLTTRSFIIPLILVLIVQTGVFLTVSGIGLSGNSIFYLALLIVQCILMGATIDYGILFTNYYVEHRKACAIREATQRAYEGAIHTIATSGLILVLVTSIIGRLFGDPTITAIVNTLSIGSLVAIILILAFLPGILITFDRGIIRKTKGKGQ